MRRDSAIPQDCSGGTWYLVYQNGACTLFPADARNDKMTVRKNQSLDKCIYFHTDVCAFSEAVFEEILASIRCPKTPPIRNQFQRLGARLNMDQGHPITNWMVKFVISCFVVSKQVEVSTILVSVESTGPWLLLLLVRCLCVK